MMEDRNKEGRGNLFYAFAKIIGLGDHVVNHSADGLPRGIKFLMLLWLEVATVQRIVQPRLGFVCFTDRGGQFAHKGGGISPMTPSLGNHGFDSARRTPDLIRQGKHFFLRKSFGHCEYTACLSAGLVIGPQISKTSDDCHRVLELSVFHPQSSTFHPHSFSSAQRGASLLAMPMWSSTRATTVSTTCTTVSAPE